MAIMKVIPAESVPALEADSRLMELLPAMYIEVQHQADTVLWVGNRKALSWGPRHKYHDEETLYPINGETIDFWTLFIHGADNEFDIIADLGNKRAIIMLARQVFDSWLLHNQDVIVPEGSTFLFDWIHNLVKKVSNYAQEGFVNYTQQMDQLQEQAVREAAEAAAQQVV